MERTVTDTTRFAIAICTLALCSFLTVDPAAGQFAEEWEKSKADGNHPTYISDGEGYNARGLAYGVVNDGNGNMVERVFVASNANGPYRLYVVDANDGTLLDSLDVSGVASEGYRYLNDVAVSDDGIIMACNAARGDFGLAQPFNCYRWDDLADSPTQVIDGAAMDERVGAHITVNGLASDNSLVLHTAAVASNKDSMTDAVFQFTTDDNGASFMTDTLRTSSEGSTPNIEDVHPTADGGYYHTWLNEPPQQYDSNQDLVGQMPDGQRMLTSLEIFEVGGQTYLAGAKSNYFSNGDSTRARVYNIENGAANATFYGETPFLGTTANIQANGDADVRVNNDETATVFLLATNNGVGAFTTTEAPLPVEIVSLAVERNGTGAVLSWKTASETNNAGFAVQHAVGSGNFEQIGWVGGAGTTTEAQTYRFTAEDLSAGTHRFRLKQKDLDGGTSLSDAVTVKVRPEGPVDIQDIAPHPIRKSGTLAFSLRENGTVNVALYDALGRRVRTLHQGRAAAGQHQVPMDVSALSSGVYFLRVEGDGFSKTRRVTVVQ